METGSSKEISGLKALIPMICAIIGDTQDTGKQEEAGGKQLLGLKTEEGWSPDSRHCLRTFESFKGDWPMNPLSIALLCSLWI